jgi:DNA-binding CsgD family transcriptional regulator
LIALSSVIGDIYDAAMNPALWQQALGRICGFVGGASAALLTHDGSTGRSRVLHLFNEEAFSSKLYRDQRPGAHPAFPEAFLLGAGQIATIDDIVPRQKFVQTPLYKQWAEPRGIVDLLLVNLERDAKHACLIEIFTSAPPSEHMRGRLAVLVPHLRRAVAGGRLLDPRKAVASLQAQRGTLPAASSIASIARRYRLTASELRVLEAMLEVNGVKAMAQMLSLSQATVKTHLHNLFRKTGARRQSDLVKLVAGI